MVASRSVSDSDNEFTTCAVPLKVYTSSAGKLEMCHLDCSHFSSLNASCGGFWGSVCSCTSDATPSNKGTASPLFTWRARPN